MRGRCQLNKPVRQGEKRKRLYMSANHLVNIRECCCLICGGHPVDAHHLLRTGEHGMGRRSSDRWATPLCRGLDGHHKGPDSPHAHGDEDAWFASYGLDGRAIAKALWAARWDLEAMQRIAFNAAQKVRTGV